MTYGQHFFVTITDDDQSSFKRLDQLLESRLEELSRTFIKHLFDQGHVSVCQDSEVRPNKIELKKIPPVGTKILIEVPPPRDALAIGEDIPLNIIFEDEHLLFINKEAGMVVHPAPGNYSRTLVNAIIYHCKDLRGVGDQRRPGIVHRLDKGTSGVMVVAKEQRCHEKLVQLFAAHNIDRLYEALVIGKDFPIGGTLKSKIGRHPQNRLKMANDVAKGREAVTHYKMLTQFEKFAHLEVKLETGRTHQIRVHLSGLLNRAILCDPLYGNPQEHLQRLGADLKRLINDYPYPFLHAKRLGLVHPMTGESLCFEVPAPQIFLDVLEMARRDAF